MMLSGGVLVFAIYQLFSPSAVTCSNIDQFNIIGQ
jgi:hypothetical protein